MRKNVHNMMGSPANLLERASSSTALLSQPERDVLLEPAHYSTYYYDTTSIPYKSNKAMHLSNLIGFVTDLSRAISIAFLPTLKAVWRTPAMALSPQALRREFMAHVWVEYGPGIDGNTRALKERLVTASARGVVLDVGAGHGHLAPYLDRAQVTAYIALEPNRRMHPFIRAKAQECGFSEEEGSFLLLPYGAEEMERIREAIATWAAPGGVGERFVRVGSPHLQATTDAKTDIEAESTHVISTLVLILTLCSLPAPHSTLRGLVGALLAPGGQVLFFEHVRNPRRDVQWWQDAVRPVWWWAFDGCVVGLDGVGVVRSAADSGESASEVDTAATGSGRDIGNWAEMETWTPEGEDAESLFWHQAGRCVKKS